MVEPVVKALPQAQWTAASGYQVGWILSFTAPRLYQAWQGGQDCYQSGRPGDRRTSRGASALLEMMRRLTLAGFAFATVAVATAAFAATILDGASIANSGSTNATGWSIAIRSDSRGTIAVTGGAKRPFRAPVAVTAQFFADLASARASGLANVQTCMKSASFGSATIAHYHGWSSPDFGCPQHALLGAALARDVFSIEAAAGVPGLGLRRQVYRFPNEPRRTEPTQTPRQGP